jgi:hypothetical protein
MRERNRMNHYTLQGFTSDGDSFDFGGYGRFTDREAAIAYAAEYARAVTGTDEVLVDRTGDEVQIRAIGENYTETVSRKAGGSLTWGKAGFRPLRAILSDGGNSAGCFLSLFLVERLVFEFRRV